MDKNDMFLLIQSYMQHNNFAHNLYVAYMTLFECTITHNKVINKAPAFFDITRYALSKCMLLEFSKLYHGSNNERTIRKLINIVMANLHLFEKDCGKSICDKAKNEMETTLKLIIEALETRRNRDLAHNDPIFFDSGKNPANNNYISCEDINNLYDFTFNLLDDLMKALQLDKKVQLDTGADDFKAFIDEYKILIENGNNTVGLNK